MADTILALTALGQALKAKIEKGDGEIPLKITRIVSAAGSSPFPLFLTALVNPKLEFSITGSQQEDERTTISATLTNLGDEDNGIPPLAEGYPLSQIGFFAEDPDLGEILYRISQFNSPIPIPAANERGWTYEPTFEIVTGNTAQVIIQVDQAGVVKRDEMELLLSVKADLVAGVVPPEQLPDLGGTYIPKSDIGAATGGTLSVARGGTGNTEGKSAAVDIRTMTPNLHDWIPYGSIGLFVGEGSNVTNAPDAGWWRYLGISHSNVAGYITILAMSLITNTPPVMYMKTCVSGTWSAWYEMAALTGSGGTLPVARGGTGKTTLEGAAGVANALFPNSLTSFGAGVSVAMLGSGWSGNGYVAPQGLRNAMGLGNTLGVLPVANGGTSATNQEGFLTNFFPTQSSAPAWFLGADVIGFGGGGHHYSLETVRKSMRTAKKEIARVIYSTTFLPGNYGLSIGDAIDVYMVGGGGSGGGGAAGQAGGGGGGGYTYLISNFIIDVPSYVLAIGAGGSGGGGGGFLGQGGGSTYFGSFGVSGGFAGESGSPGHGGNGGSGGGGGSIHINERAGDGGTAGGGGSAGGGGGWGGVGGGVYDNSCPINPYDGVPYGCGGGGGCSSVVSIGGAGGGAGGRGTASVGSPSSGVNAPSWGGGGSGGNNGATTGGFTGGAGAYGGGGGGGGGNGWGGGNGGPGIIIIYA